MTHGLDTGFLVAAEVVEHAAHVDARATLARLLGAGNLFAIAPQVLAEFIHVATDPRRFAQPLDMAAARHIANQVVNRRPLADCAAIALSSSAGGLTFNSNLASLIFS
jgi:predicted nucleic acid-binding protein